MEFNRERILLFNKGWRINETSACQKRKKKSRHRPYAFQKNEQKWIIALCVKHKTIKTIEDTIEEKST